MTVTAFFGVAWFACDWFRVEASADVSDCVFALQAEVAALECDKERMARDKASAEAEAEKMAREGPGGTSGG